MTNADGKDIDFANEWDFKHEGGIVAAKYDQPGYVAALKILATKEWTYFYLIVWVEQIYTIKNLKWYSI